MKVAIVYDRVNKWGGAERILLTLHEMFPEAPLYTSVYDAKGASWAKVFPKIHTSFLQKIPFAKNNHQLLPFLMPLAFESFNFDEYDLVISVTSEAAKGVITKPETKHLCYLLSPTRYLWSGYEEYFKNPLLRFFANPIVKYLRRWDRIAAQRPDVIVAISSEVQKRIKKYYDRNSEIIFPPSNLEVENLKIKSMNNFYLMVGRLIPYKRVDLAIKAFNRLKYPLVIAGRGSDEWKLKLMSTSGATKFIGQVTDKELASLYANCKALIFPQNEDFGLVAVEAQSFGKPVIAYKSGGALDTVIEGQTGTFFVEQNWQALYDAVKRFEKMKFDSKMIVRHAQKFVGKNFKRQFSSLVKKYNQL